MVQDSWPLGRPAPTGTENAVSLPHRHPTRRCDFGAMSKVNWPPLRGHLPACCYSRVHSAELPTWWEGQHAVEAAFARWDPCNAFVARTAPTTWSSATPSRRASTGLPGGRPSEAADRDGQGDSREVASRGDWWRVKEVHPELQRAAIRLVGNWTTTLRLAGLDPEVHRDPRETCIYREAPCKFIPT